MKRVMSKPIRNRLISGMLTFCMTFVIGTEAFAQGNSLKQEKGKYYGVQLNQKDKVKTINKAASKTTKPIRKPTVKNSKQAFEFSLKANQEVKEKRGINSKTFNEGNGKQKTYVYLDKIHYKDSSGQLQNIDNTLIQQGKGNNQSYENKANDYNVTFPAQLTKDNSIKQFYRTYPY